MHFLEIVGERDRCLCADRVGKGVRDNVRIAVAVTADPGARAQERRQTRRRVDPEFIVQPLLHGGVELRQLGEESVAVVGEPIVDLIEHAQPRQAQHRGLPQREHLAVEAGFELDRLVRRKLHAVAPLQQPGDLAFAFEDAPALHRWSDARSQRHQRAANQRASAARRRPPPPCGQPRTLPIWSLTRRARRRRPRWYVLGNVDEVRVRKCANDTERPGRSRVAEQRLQLALD